MKASDIADEQIYADVARQTRERGYCGAIIWNTCQAFPQFPEKVVFAKVRQMIAKGRLNGCGCGCRGDLCFPWQDFGDKPDIENWQGRVGKYVEGGRHRRTPARVSDRSAAR